MKLGKLHRNSSEQTFENIFLFLIIFPRCFPRQLLGGVPGGGPVHTGSEADLSWEQRAGVYCGG